MPKTMRNKLIFNFRAKSFRLKTFYNELCCSTNIKAQVFSLAAAVFLLAVSYNEHKIGGERITSPPLTDAYEYLCKVTSPSHRFHDGNGTLWYGHSTDISPKSKEWAVPFVLDNTNKTSLQGVYMTPVRVDKNMLLLRLYNYSQTSISVDPYVKLEVKLSDGWYGDVPRPEIVYFDDLVGLNESYDVYLMLSADLEGNYLLPAGRYRARVEVNDGCVYTMFDLFCSDGVYTATAVAEG